MSTGKIGLNIGKLRCLAALMKQIERKAHMIIPRCLLQLRQSDRRKEKQIDISMCTAQRASDQQAMQRMRSKSLLQPGRSFSAHIQQLFKRVHIGIHAYIAWTCADMLQIAECPGDVQIILIDERWQTCGARQDIKARQQPASAKRGLIWREDRGR